MIDRKIIALVFLVLTMFSWSAVSEVRDVKPALMTITNNAVGSFSLIKEKEISLNILRKAFPRFRIIHEIGMGDSPDFHRFTVIERFNNEELFSLRSYISDDSGYEKQNVPLHEVVVYSDRIVDEFGVKVGMRVEEAAKRRDSLKLGRGHHGYFFGADQLWYHFPSAAEGVLQPSELLELKSPIKVMSWPEATWQ